MTRYGPQFGPDITFLGVDRVDLDDAAALAGADVVVVGAPFDGGTSHRPGTRFGPTAIRQTDYLPHDGSRPHLALRVDALQDLRVLDAGDVEMPPGEIERAGHPIRSSNQPPIGSGAARQPSATNSVASASAMVCGPSTRCAEDSCGAKRARRAGSPASWRSATISTSLGSVKP